MHFRIPNEELFSKEYFPTDFVPYALRRLGFRLGQEKELDPAKLVMRMSNYWGMLIGLSSMEAVRLKNKFGGPAYRLSENQLGNILRDQLRAFRGLCRTALVSEKVILFSP